MANNRSRILTIALAAGALTIFGAGGALAVGNPGDGGHGGSGVAPGQPGPGSGDHGDSPGPLIVCEAGSPLTGSAICPKPVSG